MGSATLTIRRLQSGGVITNYDCVSSCGHCLYRCGPHRPADYIDEQTLRQAAEVMNRLGCRSVHVGGGEPFARPDRLADALAVADELGLGIEYVETNSSWFSDLDSACELLDELGGLGLGSLLVSVSPFHNAKIPFSKVRGVLEACRRTRLHPFVWVPGFIDEISALGEDETHKLSEYERHYGTDYLTGIPGRYWIHFGGRALSTFARAFPTDSAAQIVRDNPHGCRELTRTEHFHIDLYGNYVPGLCSGLAIRMQDLGAPLDPDRYPLLLLLHERGIEGLYELASNEHDFQPRERGYIAKCDLCDHIRRHFAKLGLYESELRPAGFYGEPT
jgi:hypothetical protein